MEPTVFGTLNELRDRSIPDQAAARAKKRGARALPIDRGARGGNEPLVALSAFGIAGENYYHTPRNPPYWQRIDGSIPDLLARRGVAERLVAINARLAPIGLALHIFDAWRPRAVQVYFHDHWMPAQLKARDPSLSGEALRAAVETYWAAPTEDAASPAPHETGAAIDLTLRWTNGEMLWMGSLFDDATALAHRDRFEHAGDTRSFSDEEARANRRLLHWLMAEEGFAGHPDEWWHFSYGDQLWAALTDGTAQYGLAAPEGAMSPPA